MEFLNVLPHGAAALAGGFLLVFVAALALWASRRAPQTTAALEGERVESVLAATGWTDTRPSLPKHPLGWRVELRAGLIPALPNVALPVAKSCDGREHRYSTRQGGWVGQATEGERATANKVAPKKKETQSAARTTYVHAGEGVGVTERASPVTLKRWEEAADEYLRTGIPDSDDPVDLILVKPEVAAEIRRIERQEDGAPDGWEPGEIDRLAEKLLRVREEREVGLAGWGLDLAAYANGHVHEFDQFDCCEICGFVGAPEQFLSFEDFLAMEQPERIPERPAVYPEGWDQKYELRRARERGWDPKVVNANAPSLGGGCYQVQA